MTRHSTADEPRSGPHPADDRRGTGGNHIETTAWYCGKCDAKNRSPGDRERLAGMVCECERCGAANQLPSTLESDS